MDLQLINKLIETVTSSGLKSFEVEENGFRLKLENNPCFITTEQTSKISMTSETVRSSAAPVVQSAAPQNAPEAAEKEDIAEDESRYYYVKAPIVGVYCPLSALGKESLKPGDKVTAGSIVCAIEAMKLINEIKCDVDGEFVEALAEDGQEVEYGQLLMKIKRV